MRNALERCLARNRGVALRGVAALLTLITTPLVSLAGELVSGRQTAPRLPGEKNRPLFSARSRSRADVYPPMLSRTRK